MAAPTIRTIGAEGEPLVRLDAFAPDADALRAAARAAAWGPAGEHYPGLRAPLPAGWLRTRMPSLAAAIGRAFGRVRRVHVVDASFSMVTTPPAALSLKQRLPHVDAFGRERIALVHYLSDDLAGTAFFRHRATGFETVDAARAPAYFAAVDAELGGAAPQGYVAGDTPLFQRTELAAAAFNRAYLYRSYLLHSGAIAPDAVLSDDPAQGRLTITGFFAVE
jgi:hypothetical protein